MAGSDGQACCLGPRGGVQLSQGALRWGLLLQWSGTRVAHTNRAHSHTQVKSSFLTEQLWEQDSCAYQMAQVTASLPLTHKYTQMRQIQIRHTVKESTLFVLTADPEPSCSFRKKKKKKSPHCVRTFLQFLAGLTLCSHMYATHVHTNQAKQ